jgi:hypothetical protein
MTRDKIEVIMAGQHSPVALAESPVTKEAGALQIVPTVELLAIQHPGYPN